MTERATPTNKGIWNKIGDAVSSALLWAIISAILAALFTLLVADWITLGPRFIYGLITAWSLASVAGALVVWWNEHQKAEETNQSKKWPLTPKQTVLGVIAVALAIAVGFAVNIGIREIKEVINERKADDARHRFAVTSYLGGGGDFEMEAVNQTLAKLEDSYQQLKETWTLPEQAGRIKVWLFRDLRYYQLQMNTDLAGAHLWCSLEIESVELGPVIVIPLEKAPSASTDDNFSRTPMHEMVHALMCLSVGEEAFHSIPRWFLEGMAERYETEGITRIGMRATDRMNLWLNIQQPTDTDRFCARRFSERNRSDQSAFYRTSHEFVRSLESRHSLQTLNLIVKDVRTGSHFEDSMERRLGGTCVELYSEWKESF